MISTVQIPDLFTFARNQNVVKLRATDAGGQPYRALGARSSLAALTVGASEFPLGAAFTISYTDPDTLASQTVAFTAIAGVPGDGQVIAGAGTATTTYIQEVFGRVMAHPQLAPYFSFSVATIGAEQVLQIEGIDRTFNYNINVSTGNSGWAGGAALAPAASNVPENYAVRVDVYFERVYNGGGWEQVARLSVQPGDNGYVCVDLESILTAEWNGARRNPLSGVEQPILTQPDTQSAWIYDNVRRYYVRWGEQQGTLASVGGWTSSGMRYALDGGVTKRAWAAGNYLSSVAPDMALATWRPRTRRVVSELQPVFLSYYNKDNYNTISARVTPISEAGVVGTPFTAYGQSVPIGATITFPVGVTALGLDMNTVRSYVVEIIAYDLSGAGIPVASVVYNIDCLYYVGMRFLVGRNSWGVPEDLRITGHYAEQSEISRSRAVRPLALGYSAHHAERIQWDDEEVLVRTYRTGYISREEVIALRDLLRINDIWEVTPSGQMCALDVLTDRFRIYDTRDFLYSVEFEATTRLGLGNHGPDVSADDYAYANNVLPVPSGGYWIDGTPENWEDGSGNEWQYGG